MKVPSWPNNFVFLQVRQCARACPSPMHRSNETVQSVLLFWFDMMKQVSPFLLFVERTVCICCSWLYVQIYPGRGLWDVTPRSQGERSSSEGTAMHLSDSDMSVCLTCIIYERPEWKEERAYEQGSRRERGRDRHWGDSETGGKAVYSRVDTYRRWKASVFSKKRLNLVLWCKNESKSTTVEKDLSEAHLRVPK